MIVKTIKDISSFELCDDSLQIASSQRAVALGLFDSLHEGHTKVLDEMLKISSSNNLIPVVQTFSSFDLKGDRMVLTLDERLNLFDKMGVKEVYVLEFNDTIKNTLPESFINDLIIEKLNSKFVISGEDYTFGYKGQGDVSLLKDILDKRGVSFKVVEAVLTEDKNKISTSLIKSYLTLGEVKKVSFLCGGRCFSYKGEIIHGNELGRTLGFPTINILIPDNKYLVRRGVYLTKTTVEGKTYNSISNVGLKPTIAESTKRDIIETHLYDFDGDIYGKDASVELIEFVRDEKHFDNIDELRKQVLFDKDYCYKWHNREVNND